MSELTQNVSAAQSAAPLAESGVKPEKDGATFEAYLPPGFVPQSGWESVSGERPDKGAQGNATEGKQIVGEQMSQGRERRRPSSYAASPYATAVNTPHYGSSPPSYGTPLNVASTSPYGTPFYGAQPILPQYRAQSFGTPYHGTPSRSAQPIGFSPPSYRAQSFGSPYQVFPVDNGPPPMIPPSFAQPDTLTPELYIPTTRETAIHSYLLRKVVVGAGLDSAVRFPPPRCDPGTRQALRERIASWLIDPTRFTNLLWLHGPVMVGKSAVAQTIAEHCKDKGWLGATFFFSRSRDDLGRIIPTLVYQLAVTYPAYKELASNNLLTDPTILEQTLRAQFRKLINEPLFQLRERGTRMQPLLLLLDGLDECRSGTAVQQEFIELVAEFALAANASKLPVVWIITSRTEWEIISTFSKYQCWKEELRIDTAENIQDVSTFLHNGFAKVREKNENLFSEGRIWPREDQLSVISSVTSGSFAFASAILHLIGSGGFANPVARLETCMNSLQGNPWLVVKEPWLPLRTGYWDVYSNIPGEVWPTTVRILAFLALIIKNDVPAQLLANILFLDQATFYASLRPLYSVMDIPEPKDASRLPIRSHHASFLDFIRIIFLDDKLGISSSVTDVDLPTDLQSFYVRWCDLWGMKCTRKLSNEAFQSYIPWPGEQAPNDIFQSVSANVWEMWSSWHLPDLYGHFYCFNFSAHHDTGLFSQKIWPDMQHPTPVITNLFCRLNAWVADTHKGDILRSEPKYITDLRLFEAYAYLINYKTMKKVDFPYIESNPTGWSYVCLSLEGESTGARYFPRMREALLDPRPMYFLLGHDTFTCLVVMHRPTLAIRDFVTQAFEQIRTMYPESINDSGAWPAPEELEKIISASETPQEVFNQARLPSLVRTIVAFVAHPDYANPADRLKRVLEILSHNHDQTTILELLRVQSVTDIPQEIRPAADRVFAFLICYATKAPRRGIPSEKLSAFLGLEKDTVEKVLRMVNLVSSSRPLPYPMGAVADFDLSDLLNYCNGERAFVPKRDRDRQGCPPNYGNVISPQAWLEICVQYIRWCDRLLVEEPVRADNSLARSEGDSESDSGSVMTREEEAEAFFKREVLAGGHWVAFSQIVKDTAPDIVAALRESYFFRVVALYCNFHIPHYDEMATHFGTFINKLYSYQTELNLEHIVRVDGNFDADHELLAKWERLGTCRKATFPIDFTWVTCYLTTSQSNWVPNLIPSGTWYYFWLGCGRNTCLVTFILEDEDEQVLSGSE